MEKIEIGSYFWDANICKANFDMLRPGVRGIKENTPDTVPREFLKWYPTAKWNLNKDHIID